MSVPFPTRRLLSLGYDNESRMREFDLNRGEKGGADRENMTYATHHEENPSLPPFLQAAIEKDRPRRNYYIAPGGRAVVFETPVPPNTTVGTERLYSAPTAKVSFGSESFPGYPGFRTQGLR